MATPVTIAEAAYDAGVRSPVPLAQATAVAIAESGGNQRAVSFGRYGLWMIAASDAAAGEQLFDVAANAAAMAARSSAGTDFSSWPTFGGARYLLVFPPAQAAALTVTAARGAGEAAQGASKAITEPIGDAVDAARSAVVSTQKAAAWLSDRNNWVRIAKVIAGVVLVGAGVAAVTRPASDAAINKLIKPIKGIL